MLVRCEQCGYENFPQHRFCGMCAAELRLPSTGGAQPPSAPKRVPSPAVPQPVARQTESAAPEREVVRQQVSGSSFLGLGREGVDKRSLSYLLEDESPSHRGRNVILILLIAAVAAAAGWHWRQDVRVLAAKFMSPSAASKVGSGTDGQDPGSSAADTPAATAPAAGANATAPVGTPSAGADGQAAATGAQTPPAAAPGAAADATQNPHADQSQTANQSQTDDSGSAAADGAAKPDDSGDAASPAPASSVVETPKVRSRAAASTVSLDDQEAEGEKYLYGNGVPENCGHARKALLAAAQHSNPKAENVLGTMYATGHCATRDLPTAYRWFSRSLRKDPSNTRIEQDLKVLWNQMTPDEQRLALRDER